MKNKIFLFFILTSSFLYAQSWQIEFQLDGHAKFLNENVDGELELHYQNSNDQSWSKILIDQAGNQLGIENYTLQDRNYHTLEYINGEHKLTYLDINDEIIWEKIISVPISSTVRTSNSGLSLVSYQHPNFNQSFGEVWIYDKNGNLVFNKSISGPNASNGWSEKMKNDGSIQLSSISATPWLPLGAATSISNYTLIDKDGVNQCSASGFSAVWDPSLTINHIAIKGNTQTCGDIGRISGGLNNPDLPKGQFIPGSSIIIPAGSEIPDNIDMIGLDNGYLILGESQGLATVTKIDCDDPIEDILCLTAFNPTQIEETICLGEVFIFEGETLTNPGEYSFKLLSDTGCDSIINLTLYVVIDTTIITAPEYLADDGNGFIMLNAECSDCTYEWSNGATTENIYLLEYGNYTVTITGQNGCHIEEQTFDLQMPSSISSSDKNKITNFVQPNICNPSENIKLRIKEYDQLNIHTIDGQLYRSPQQNNMQFSAPTMPGIYIISLWKKQKLVGIEKLVVL